MKQKKGQSKQEKSLKTTKKSEKIPKMPTDYEVFKNEYTPEELERARIIFESMDGTNAHLSDEEFLTPSEMRYFSYELDGEAIIIRKKDIKCAVLKNEEHRFVTHVFLDNGLVIKLNGKKHFDLVKKITPHIKIQVLVDSLN
jgi:hypothetical protein